MKGLCAKGCLVFGSDILVKVEKCESFYFPDLVIVCAKPQYEASDTGLNALTNPEVVIEVLSPGTEVTDRVRKMDGYKTIGNLKDYVLLSSTKKQIEVIKKLTQTEWLHHTCTHSEEHVLIHGCEILIEDIYRQVDLAQPKGKAG
jgi:Uma2 family endonuclease